ncbi:tripartite tricarboxylate transporter permease [Microvirga subterranea]|uniref:Putative tricarboxylic transport membrane protein n=1 Tax=Microvirga subterranea TaxID=186651 RepID=A0A370HGL1_9HYPH|nr:tripartite tricarboxylate transporter permease [Microvirga subterranea]RDI56792.1 putative tricarboxylic transport membrane protein [Microvirga subterranea]
MLENLASGFAVALSPWNLAYAGFGAVLGTAIGVLPGLGPPATIAMLLPLTYGMEPVSAVIMLAGIFYGAMYGGSTTSILLNIPGEAGSVVTCLDGYRMTRAGRAGAALGIAAIGSFIAGTLGVLGLSLISPILADFALRFGPAEYFSLVLLGLTMAVYLSGGSALKGLVMTVLGLLLGTIGLDPVFGAERFTFGSSNLTDGLDFVVVAMGLFGIAEVLSNLESPEQPVAVKPGIKSIFPTREDWKRAWAPIARGSFFGFFIGILPGGGAIISSFVSYAVEKKISKHPEQFGHGAIEGVAAPESANNAASVSSFIPLLTLGIPGNASIAMILVALMIHGIRPGPQLIAEHPDIFWGAVASMYLGNVMLLALNLPLVGLWVKLLQVPYSLLALVVVVICVVGAYSVHNSTFDVGVMIGFGIFGYLLRKTGFPAAPLVLAMILGPILERSLQQAMISSAGDPLIFVQHPLSAALLGVAALVALTPLLSLMRGGSTKPA